jgi:hypothetical protein
MMFDMVSVFCLPRVTILLTDRIVRVFGKNQFGMANIVAKMQKCKKLSVEKQST